MIFSLAFVSKLRFNVVDVSVYEWQTWMIRCVSVCLSVITCDACTARWFVVGDSDGQDSVCFYSNRYILSFDLCPTQQLYVVRFVARIDNRPNLYKTTKSGFTFLPVHQNLAEGLYVLLALISSFLFFLIWTIVSQDLLDRFSLFFHQMVSIYLNIINPDPFFRFLKGGYRGNRFQAKLANKPLFGTPHFKRNWNVII